MFGDRPAAAGLPARDTLASILEAAPADGLWDACLVGLHDTYRGDEGAGQRMERWFAAAAAMPSAARDGSMPCLLVQRALAAALAQDPDARTLLARADAELREAVQTHAIVLPVYNLTLARAHEAVGDMDAALAAARRAEQPLDHPWFLPEKLRTEARLAALTGDRDGALEAYRRYFALRPDPEPGVREQDERLREQFHRLAGDGR